MGFLSSLFGGKGETRKIINVAKRFDLRGRTGQGSMSKVYQAFDRELGRNVCLKLLDKDKTDRFEERFRALAVKKPTEGEICEKLKHENIVNTYEHGVTTTGEPYLIMEWVEGVGLNFLIETRSPQLNGKRINYLCQLCDALDYLHTQKYLHRDLCPRNVMVTNEGVVKLIDFGLTVPYTPEFCAPGNRTGTLDYLAPEIIKRMATDHRVDTFALGVTAYEVFTSELPWERSPSSEESLRRRLNTKARQPKELKPDIDDELASLLIKSVERDRNERFAAAWRFKEALQRLSRQDY